MLSLERNSVRRGGGLDFVHSFGPARDCLFSHNTADHGGGLQCHGNARVTVERCTFFGNDAKDGSGIYCRNNSSPTISNTIIAYGHGSPALVRFADLFGHADLEIPRVGAARMRSTPRKR